MTKPLRYDSAINFRLPRSLHDALVSACGGQENVHARLRSLIEQYVAKRARELAKSLDRAAARERPKRAVTAEATGAEP